MSSVRKIIAKEMDKSAGKAKMVKVPPERKPTTESAERLEREIESQLIDNEIMRRRSQLER